MLLARPTPPRIETVNDKDAYLANFFRAVTADPETVAHFASWPVSEPDLHARHLWLVTTAKERMERLKTDPFYFDAQVAGWWVWGINCWIGGGWCSPLSATWKQRPHLSNLNAFLSANGQEAITGLQTWQKRPHVGTAGRGVHRVPMQSMIAVGNAGRGIHPPSCINRVPHQKIPSVGAGNRCLNAPTTLEAQGGVAEWFGALSDRLRRVRVCCGDWSRVLGPSVTEGNGLTAVFLDPPYDTALRDKSCYNVDSPGLSAEVRAWAIANGHNPKLRIALCGYSEEHDMPDDWECVAWKANGGYAYGNSRAVENAHKERIWFSPFCLKPDPPALGGLFEE